MTEGSSRSSSRPIPTSLCTLAGKQKGNLGHGSWSGIRRQKHGEQRRLGSRRCRSRPETSLGPAFAPQLLDDLGVEPAILGHRARDPSAFLMARAPEAPWQMMQAPRIPSSGPPPNSSYSNRLFSVAGWPRSMAGPDGKLRHSRASSSLERREQEFDGPFAGLEQDVADEPVADDDPHVAFVDVTALDIADEPAGPAGCSGRGRGSPW